jgi:tetratricopeptide (TPR) repeat protein
MTHWSKRFVACVVVFVLLSGGCAKQQWKDSRRLETLKQEDIVTLTHVVAPGETLRTIASLYYDDPTRAEDIALANGMLNPNSIPVGAELVLAFSDEEWARADLHRQALIPFNHGVTALQDGRLQDAGDAFHAALNIDPDFFDAQYNLALVWLQRGRSEDAEAMLLPLVELKPKDPDVLLAWGQSLFYQARFPEAIAAFDKILALDSGHREAAFSRAKVLSAAEDVPAAQAAWQAFLQRHPGGSWAARARQELQNLSEID